MSKAHREEATNDQPTAAAMALSPGQQSALRAIKAFWYKHRIPPTRLDVARAMNLKTAMSAATHIQALERKQKIRIIPGAARGIRLVETEEVPLVTETGDSGDEKSLLAPGRHRNWIPKILAEQYRPAADYFLLFGERNAARLNLKGEQIVAVKGTAHPEEGDMVVAWIDDKLSCGRFSQIEKKKVELRALNPAVPRAIRRVNLYRHEFTIEGIVLGVLRGEQLPVAPRGL